MYHVAFACGYGAIRILSCSSIAAFATLILQQATKLSKLTLKLQTPQEVILPEVIYRLTSNAACVGFHSWRTRSISKGLSKYIGYRIGGAI